MPFPYNSFIKYSWLPTLILNIIYFVTDNLSQYTWLFLVNITDDEVTFSCYNWLITVRGMPVHDILFAYNPAFVCNFISLVSNIMVSNGVTIDG